MYIRSLITFLLNKSVRDPKLMLKHLNRPDFKRTKKNRYVFMADGVVADCEPSAFSDYPDNISDTHFERLFM